MSTAALRAAVQNALISLWSLMPGALSTPLATSTPSGRTARMASADVSGCRPPASRNGCRAPAGDQAPGRGHARAAERRGVGVVDEEGGIPGQRLLQRGLVVDPDGADDPLAAGSRPSCSTFSSPCSWTMSSRSSARVSVTTSGWALTNTPIFSTSGGMAAMISRARASSTKRFEPAPEVQADRRRALTGGERRVLGPGHAADLDDELHDAARAAFAGPLRDRARA